MRMNRYWMPVTALSFAAAACSPHVSVGDLGSDGGAANKGGAGATNNSGGGIATSEGGAPTSLGGASDAGKSSGGAVSIAGSPTTGDAGSGMEISGGAGVGGSPLLPGCPADLRQVLPAKTADCPEAPLTGACDWTENAICVWQDSPTQSGFTAEGCYAGLTGKVAYGLGQGSLGEVGVNNEQCPKIAPEPNSSCATHAGQHCYYPYDDCACAANDGNWQCKDNIKPVSPPREVKRLCAPTGIDETKQLKELSDQEVLAWCTWYGDPSGAPRPRVSLQDPPDTAELYVSIYAFVGVKACILELPSELCVKNIRTQPTCTATVEQLDDCIETMRAVGAGESGWVGHGCAPLMANPTCSRVIAQPIPDDTPMPNGCKTPLK